MDTVYDLGIEDISSNINKLMLASEVLTSVKEDIEYSLETNNCSRSEFTQMSKRVEDVMSLLGVDASVTYSNESLEHSLVELYEMSSESLTIANENIGKKAIAFIKKIIKRITDFISNLFGKKKEKKVIDLTEIWVQVLNESDFQAQILRENSKSLSKCTLYDDDVAKYTKFSTKADLIKAIRDIELKYIPQILSETKLGLKHIVNIPDELETYRKLITDAEELLITAILNLNDTDNPYTLNGKHKEFMNTHFTLDKTGSSSTYTAELLIKRAEVQASEDNPVISFKVLSNSVLTKVEENADIPIFFNTLNFTENADSMLGSLRSLLNLVNSKKNNIKKMEGLIEKGLTSDAADTQVRAKAINALLAMFSWIISNINYCINTLLNFLNEKLSVVKNTSL